MSFVSCSLLEEVVIAACTASEPYEVGRELDSVDQDVLVAVDTKLSGRELLAGLIDSLSILNLALLLLLFASVDRILA